MSRRASDFAGSNSPNANSRERPFSRSSRLSYPSTTGYSGTSGKTIRLNHYYLNNQFENALKMKAYCSLSKLLHLDFTIPIYN